MFLRCLALVLLASVVTPVWAQGPDYTIRIDVTAWKDGEWMEIRSRNFLVIGNAGEKKLRRIAVDLEELRRQFLAVVPYAESRSPADTIVLALRNRKSFQPFQEVSGKVPDPAGYIQAGSDVHYIVLNLDEQNRRDLYRDYTEVLIQDSPMPLWLREGLAQYFSTYTEERYAIGESRTVKIGLPIRGEKLLNERDIVPLPRLLDLDAKSPENEHNVFRAESWALVHMLLRPDGRDALKRFVRLLAAGKSQQQSLDEAFGLDVPALEAALRNYIKESRGSGWPYVVTPYCACTSSPGDWLQLNPDGLLAYVKQQGVRKISEAELKFHLGDLVLHTGNLEQAEIYLQDAVRLDPGLAAAYVSLGALRVRQKEFSKAAESLEHALSLNRENPVAEYHYAVLIREKSETTTLSQDNLESMQSALSTALQLAPHFYSARSLLIDVNRLLGQPDLNATLEGTTSESEIAENVQSRKARPNGLVISVDELEAQNKSKGKKDK